MKDERTPGKPIDDPEIELANKIILSQGVVGQDDVKQYLNAHLASTLRDMRETSNPEHRFSYGVVVDDLEEALKEWDSSRHTAVRILLQKIFFNRKVGIESTPQACKRCVDFLLGQPIVLNGDTSAYKRVIREADAITERARGQDLFSVYRAYTAALEFNAERFTLLYGRPHRSSRLRMRKEKFDVLYQRISQ